MFLGDTLNVAWDPEGFAKLIFYLLCQVCLALFRLDRFQPIEARVGPITPVCVIYGPGFIPGLTEEVTSLHLKSHRMSHISLLCSDWLLVQSVGRSTLVKLSK